MAARGTPVSTQRVGLIISAEKPHLAYSPDDLVEDESISNKHGTVEYKCPYSARELSPVEACMQIKKFYCKLEDGKLKLSHKHNYFYQIQGVRNYPKKMV